MFKDYVERELNVLVEHEKLSKETEQELLDVFTDTATICDIIDKHGYNILNYAQAFIDRLVLAPLTLYDDEFEYDKTNNEYVNSRCPYIYKTSGGNYYNSLPFYLMCRAVYDHNNKKQISNITFQDHTAFKTIYISKGGVITGDCIKTCFIKKEDVDNHWYTVPDVIKIPACIIERNGISYYVVDHREPTLKILEDLYEVAYVMEEQVASYKMNLRNYKKLNNNK